MKSLTTESRQKRFHNKVNTGCKTCKIRRVKCDQGRPGCLRCVKAGKSCEGYADPPRPWLFQPSNLYDIYKTPEERQLAGFYRNAGVHLVSRFAISAFEFWDVFVQQLVEYPAIKHAMLAHSAQMQSLKYHHAADASQIKASVYRAEAIVHYNKGIAAMASAGNNIPMEAFLVACLMFACLEMWPQEGGSPRIHVKAGLDVGLTETESTWNECSVKGYVLRGFLWIADLVSAYMDDEPRPNTKSLLVWAMNANPDSIPKSFKTSAKASECVEVLLRSVVHLCSSNPTTDSWNKHRQLIAFRTQISSAIEASAPTDSKQADFHRDLRELQVHLSVISLMLKTYGAETESAWDAYSAVYEEVLTEVEDILAYERVARFDRDPRMGHGTMGLISPLFCVATKSRDAKQRRRALAMLHRLRRASGPWNSCVATLVARTAINAEARLTPQQVPSHMPEESRVRLESVAFEPSKDQIVVSYRRMTAKGTTDSSLESNTVPWKAQVAPNYYNVHMSQRAIACLGYTGMHLATPYIECQCYP